MTWRPISLKFKNDPPEDSPFYEPSGSPTVCCG